MSEDYDEHADGDGEKVVNFGFSFASAEVTLPLLHGKMADLLFFKLFVLHDAKMTPQLLMR